MAFSEVTKRHKKLFDFNNLSAVKSHQAPGVHDFQIIKPISRGAYGQVYLAQKKESKKLFAVKCMKKKDVLNKNMMDQVVAERDALALSSKSRYVVQLFYSFQSDDKIFLVMEYMIGGDVKSLLHNLGYFDVNMAKVYIAEVILALEYLHCHAIFHRDIKPDNMLLSSKGHIKLTDFGLSCICRDRKPNMLDLINTPGTLVSDNDVEKNVFWRTPGQLQSLTSSFTFSAPRTKNHAKIKNPRRLSTLQSIQSLIETKDFIFSPPQNCLNANLNSNVKSVPFLSTPQGINVSSTPSPSLNRVISNSTGVTSEITSLDLNSAQRKRCYVELDCTSDNEKENRPSKRVRVLSHSLPFDAEIFSNFTNEKCHVHFPDNIKICSKNNQNLSDMNNKLYVPTNELQNTSEVGNISGVTELTETSHMSISFLAETEPLSPCISQRQSERQSTNKVCINSLTPKNIFSENRTKSVNATTPVQNLHFCESHSPILSKNQYPESITWLSDSKTPDCSSLSCSKISPKKTPFRTPKICVRGVATPLEKNRVLGTPDYLAPEILLAQPHGAPVDWWALGVCFYEFLTGVPPFNDDTPELVFQHILNHDMIWPDGDEALPEDCIDAINFILTEDPTRRPKAVDLKLLPCFSEINWTNLHNEKAPFIPTPDDDCDTTYFTARNLASHLKMSNFMT